MDSELDEILEALKNCNFDELYNEGFYDEVVYPFKEKYHKPFSYDSGASKGVLIFEKLDYVIKIPFVGKYEAIYDEDMDDYYDDFEMFQNADGNGDGHWDYCKEEEKACEYAKTIGVNQLLAETTKIADINGHPIYIQEYVKMYYDECEIEHTKDQVEKVKTICSNSNYNCFNSNWLADVFNYFGEEIFYKFMDFIDYWGINDLHNGNIGYRKGKPVLVDYSGWNE